MSDLLERLRHPDATRDRFRFADYPMHYFAAIQRRNQINVERKLEAINISPVDWRVLGALHEHPGLTVSDLTEITVIDRFKVSRCLGRLSERKLVEERTADQDRRRRRTFLTEAGLATYRDAYGIMSQVYLANFDGLSEADLEVLMTLLQKIKDNVYRVEGY